MLNIVLAPNSISLEINSRKLDQ